MKKLTFQSNNIQTKNSHNQSGFSLIEVMIAALILSIGVLGVAGLQIVGMKGTQQSYMKQQAADLVSNLTERMRSNKQGVIGGNYLLNNVNDVARVDCSIDAPVCSAVNCSTPNVALLDLHNTVCGFKAVGTAHSTGGLIRTNPNDMSIFLGGDLSITCPNGCATGDVRIQVQWMEREFGEEDNTVAGVPVKDSLIINTRILP